MKLNSQQVTSVLDSIRDSNRVTGATHTFYRYPARFSPAFAKAAIEAFTEPGDLVYDPFMGGGTSLVESMRLGRRSIGTDLNSLAVFVSKAKTTLFTDKDIAEIRAWVNDSQSTLKLTKSLNRSHDWVDYQKHISGPTTWPIRDTIELALSELDSLRNERQQRFVRCLILKTSQWAIDCRKNPPSAGDFRSQLNTHVEEMIQGALSLRLEVQQLKHSFGNREVFLPKCLHRSAKGIGRDSKRVFSKPPKLIVTSPPYPGVHVLYHRWQVNGRRETPMPYWIANCLDGQGASHYTFGARKQKELEGYFTSMQECYQALAEVSDHNTWLVQLVAFSEPEWQLPKFLEVLTQCGFAEVLIEEVSKVITNGRAWRQVPSRKFYANGKGHTASSKEVLLLHQLV